jgi:hypothetical protein
MSRLAAGLTGVVLGLSMITVLAGDTALAQPDRQRGARGGAPMARPPAPAMRQAPVVRQAPAMRQMPAMRHAPPPRMAAPPRQAPRMAVPQRQAPSFQRAAPRAPAINRAERREMRIQQRREAQQPAAIQRRAITGAQPKQQNAQERIQSLQQQRRLNQAERRELRELRRTERARQQQESVRPNIQHEAVQSTQQGTDRLKELQQQRRLNRAERRELRQLQRAEREKGQQDRRQQAIQANPDRLKELQEQRQRGRLSREERRELRELRRAEREKGQQQQQQQQQTTRVNPDRLKQLQEQRQQGRLSREERLELRQLRRAERQQQFGAAGQRQAAWQAAAQGRFASKFHDHKERRDGRRAARLWAKAAWRLGLLAHYVPWYGPVYWPYAYHDIFYYTFWPAAYEPGYWAFVYDDFFDGVFFPYGAPYVDYAYVGPYDEGTYTRRTTGTRSVSRAAPGRAAPSGGAPDRTVSRSGSDACAQQATAITAWPFDEIEQEVRLDDKQKDLLAELKQASQEAAQRFKEACPENLPMTPPGRLQAMIMRLQATLDAVKTVRPPLEAFYASLSDEQKARFNEIGPRIARERPRAANQRTAQADCSRDMAGLSSVPIDRIEDVVQPTDAQLDALDRLDEALTKAVDTLSQACPTTVAETPVGRLETMEKRLEAMIAAANTVRPALDDFYAALSNEQKAKFNRMGRDTARADR